MKFTPKVRTLEELMEAFKGIKAKIETLKADGDDSSSIYRELKASLGTLACAMGAEANDGRSIVPSDEYVEFRKCLW